MTSEHVSVPRDEFEKWMIEEMGYPRADLYFASARNCYRSYHVHLAWKAWEQAILSRATLSDDKTSAPRMVTDAHVAVAERAYMDAFNTRQNRMRAALESFATSLPMGKT